MSASTQSLQFQLVGGHPCLDFTNTLDNRGSSNEIDLISSYELLLQFAQQCGAFPAEDVRKLRNSADTHRLKATDALTEALRLRETIFQIFSAMANRKPPSQASLRYLNLLVTEAGGHRIVVPIGEGFAWRWNDIGTNPKAVLWPFAWMAAELLASDDLAAVRECASPSCSWLFLDKSKSHSRRWCDMKVCGNRLKVRRFYERTRAQS
jgi:predicted RNA-binding Zn ribbon-like protein